MPELSVIAAGGSTPAASKPSNVAHVVAILRHLGRAERAVGVNAIARNLSLAPSSCFKILKALQAESLVEFDECAKTYSLGSGAIAIARRALDPAQAFPNLRPHLEDLSYEHHVAFGLWRTSPQQQMVLIGFVDSGREMRIHLQLGHRLSMFVGGVGRAIAAAKGLDEQTLRAEFARLRWQRPVTFEDYLRDIESARQTGYGIDRGHFSHGVTTIGVALADDAGNVSYGLSAIMFNGQYDEPGLQKIGRLTVRTGQWALARLGLDELATDKAASGT